MVSVNQEHRRSLGLLEGRRNECYPASSRDCECNSGVSCIAYCTKKRVSEKEKRKNMMSEVERIGLRMSQHLLASGWLESVEIELQEKSLVLVLSPDKTLV